MAGTEDEIKIAESEFNVAREKLNKCIPGNQGFGIEAKYAQAYQRLVLLGVRPQLKLKYRG
jgi:hypothetical protein